jgi:hypothetical protein
MASVRCACTPSPGCSFSLAAPIQIRKILKACNSSSLFAILACGTAQHWPSLALSSIGHSWSAAQHSPPLPWHCPAWLIAHHWPGVAARVCTDRCCVVALLTFSLLGMRIGVGSHSGTAVSFSSEKAKAVWSKCFARCATLTLPLSL